MTATSNSFEELTTKMDDDTFRFAEMLVRLRETCDKPALDAVRRIVEEAIVIQEACNMGGIAKEEACARLERFCDEAVAKSC